MALKRTLPPLPRNWLVVLVWLILCFVVGLITTSLYRDHADAGDSPPAWMAPERYRDCNRSLARAYHRLVPRRTDQQADQFRLRAWRLLAAVVSACERLGVPHWLGAGTLLGFIRQCDLVPEMDDVDIEVASEPFTGGNVTVAELVDSLTSAGLKWTSQFGRLGDSLELAFKDDAGTRIDVFLSYPDGENRYMAGVDVDTLKKIRWVYPKITLCWSTLRGLVVGVPCDSHHYLETNYGPNWTQPPLKTWNYRQDAANTVDNGAWPEEARQEVVKQFT